MFDQLLLDMNQLDKQMNSLRLLPFLQYKMIPLKKNIVLPLLEYMLLHKRHQHYMNQLDIEQLCRH